MVNALSVNRVIRCLNETRNKMVEIIKDKNSIDKIRPCNSKLFKSFLPKNDSPYLKRTSTEEVFFRLKSAITTVLIYWKNGDKKRANDVWERTLNECMRICASAGKGSRVGNRRVVEVMEELRDVFKNNKSKVDNEGENHSARLSKMRNKKIRERVNKFRKFREDVEKKFNIENYDKSCNKGRVLLPIFSEHFPKNHYENGKTAFSRYIMKFRDSILNLENNIYLLRGENRNFDEYCNEIRGSGKWTKNIDFIKKEINQECSRLVKKFSKDISLDNFNMSSKEKISSSLSNSKIQEEIKKTSNLFGGFGITDDGQSFKFYR